VPQRTGIFGTWLRSAHRSSGDLHAEALAWLRSVRFTVHLLEGTTPHGHRLRVLYSGSAPYRHYVRRHIFANSDERALGRYWRWQLPGLAGRLHADLRITRCARRLRRLLPARVSCFYVPEWVWCMRTLDAQSVYGKRKPWTSVEKHGFSSRVTSDVAALCHFYERMYLPLMNTSHGESAQLMKRHDMLRRVADGEAELLSIEKDGTAVAGCVIVYEGGEARLFSRGVLDADKGLLRQRVGDALSLYSIAYLLERGFSRVNLGRARPFLEDGALRFKLERGAYVTSGTDMGVDIEPLNASLGTHDFFYANPMIGEDADGLVAVFFAAADGTTCMPPRAPAGVRRVAVRRVDEAIREHAPLHATPRSA